LSITKVNGMGCPFFWLCTQRSTAVWCWSFQTSCWYYFCI